MNEIYEDVKNSAYQIIERKGATFYAVAAAIQRICEAIVRDENSVLPVSSLVDGHYGLHGLCLGLPAIVGRSGVKRILDFPLSATEQAALRHSADTLKSVLETLD